MYKRQNVDKGVFIAGAAPGIYAGTAFKRGLGMQIRYEDLSFGEDEAFVGRFRERGRLGFHRYGLDFIYRWGMNLPHVSGYGDTVDGYKIIGEQVFEPAILEIEPKWQMDYEAQARVASARKPIEPSV